MKRNFTLAKQFLRKNRSSIFSFSLILLISTLLFASALTVNNNVSKDYDALHEQLNTGNAFFTVPAVQYTEDLVNALEELRSVEMAEGRRGVMLSVSVEMEGSQQEQTQIFFSLKDNGQLNRFRIVEGSAENTGKGICIANYTYIHSSLEPGSQYAYSFPVIGVLEEMQYGNYASSVIGQYLTEESFQELLEQNPQNEVVVISVKAPGGREAYTDVSKYLNEKGIRVISKNYDENIKNQRLAISNILVLILLVFSGVVLLISLLVSKFKIQQSMEEEMANMGVLKALGYTGNEIILGVILPYLISGLTVACLGAALSYLLLPVLGNVIMMQSGFRWQPGADITADLTVILISLLLITVFTLLPAARIRKLNPINAIRGIRESKAERNHFEMDKTAGGVGFLLMLKNFVNTKKQNVLLGIVLFFMTVAASFVIILFYNINLNPMNFINTLVEEHPSVVVSTDADIEEELEKLDHVEQAIYYDEQCSVSYRDDSYKTFVSETFEYLANDLCYEGSNPGSDREVAVGSRIRETCGLQIGDIITLSRDGREEEYEITGFIQSVNYSGEVLELTIDGYRRIEPDYVPGTIYLYLDDESQAGKVIAEIEETHETINSTVNYAESMESAMELYVSLVGVICIVIIVITVLLIFLILYILISSIITRQKQELGIFKAIGYENGQLVRQLVGGFIPGSLLAAILGTLVSKLILGNVYGFIFQAVGAYKVNFVYPTGILCFVALGLMVSTVIIGAALAERIRKISVYSLIRD